MFAQPSGIASEEDGVSEKFQSQEIATYITRSKAVRKRPNFIGTQLAIEDTEIGCEAISI